MTKKAYLGHFSKFSQQNGVMLIGHGKAPALVAEMEHFFLGTVVDPWCVAGTMGF